MADKKKWTIEELAKITNSQPIGNLLHPISGIAEIQKATSSQASFLTNVKYRKHLDKTQAGLIIVPADFDYSPYSFNFLLSQDPEKCAQTLMEIFQTSFLPTIKPGIHPTAVVHKTAKLGQDVTIAAFCVIEEKVTIQDHTVIYPHVTIGNHSSIGNHCLIYPNVTIREHIVIGNRVTIQPGVVIGSCGYGFRTDAQGKHHKLNQLGNVIIEDDVEIGANTTIDRARFTSTIIGRGTKIDNLVQIAHGCEVGEDNLIVAQVGLAGSSKTGKRVVLAGQSATTGHVSITDNVIVAARGAVTKDINEPGQYAGAPLTPMKDFRALTVHMRNLDNYVKKIKFLEKEIEKLKSQLKLQTKED